MSYITPKNYKIIAEKLAAGYKKVKEAIYKSGDDTCAYELGLDTFDYVFSDTYADESVSITSADPTGSIANDLSTVWYKFTHSTMTETEAKKIASSLFSNTLSRLNSHVVTRTNVRNYATWLSTYAYVNGNTDMSLFESGGGNNSYFTADFVELSAQIGVTIDPQYKQA